MVRRNSGGHDVLVYAYAAVAAVVLLAGVWLVQVLKKGRGALVRGERQYRVFTQRANFDLVTATCLISLAVLLAGVVLGGTAAYYLMFAMLGWLILLLVYYTVKMM